MKKTLLIAALGLISTATFAQNAARVLSGDAKLEKKIAKELSDQSSVKYLNQATQFINNRTVNTASKTAGGAVDIRADYQGVLFDLFGGNTTFGGSFITVFPDTAIVQEGSDGTTDIFFRPSNHGLVYMYDNKSELFGNDLTTGVENYFSPNDVVNVDSIFTAGIYFLNNPLATNDRLRYDIVTGPWGTGAFSALTGAADVDADGVDDNISIQTLRITGSASNGVVPYNITGATTVFRTFSPNDSDGVQDYGLDLSASNITIPANGGFGVLISYEPTPGSYTPNMDTTSLNDGTGDANIFRSLVLSNDLAGDDNMYFIQFSAIGSQFFNNNSVTGFVSDADRYNTAVNTTNAYLFATHTTTMRVHGTSSVSVTELDNNKGKFSIYPNPNNGNFNLKLENFKGDDTYTITVMNILGQTVHEEVVTMNNGVKSFSFSNLDKGMYLMNISSKNINTVERITIK